MTDTSHAGAAGPAHRAVETGVAAALIAFGAIVVIGSGLYLYLVRRRKTGHRQTYSGIDTYTART